MTGTAPMLKLYGTRWPTVQRTGEGQPFALSWSALAKALAKPRRVVGEKNVQPIWTFGRFADHYRDGAHHEASCALVLDYDAAPNLDAMLLESTWGDTCFLAHTSWSHTPDKPKWRVIVPLSRDVDIGEYKVLMGAAARRLAGLDTRPAPQGYFVPLARDGYLHVVHADGLQLDVDNTLEAEREREAVVNEGRRPAAPVPQSADDVARRYALAALDNEARALASMPKGSGQPGGRHQRALLAGKSMGELEESCGLARGVVEGVLLDAARACGLDDKDAVRTIGDGYAIGLTTPRAPQVREAATRTRVQPPPPRADVAPIAGREGEPSAAEGDDSADPAFYRCTDMGNSERFRDQHQGALRYCDDLGGWYSWDGSRWSRDIERRHLELAKETAISIEDEANSIIELSKDEEEQRIADSVRKWARRSESAGALRALVFLAESAPPFPVLVDAWDADPWLLGVKNGVVNLRTGEVREARQGDLMTHRAEIEYDPAAECPRWMQFLDEIMVGREALVGFLQRAIGYSLTGSAREQVLFFLHGEGANGKSTLLNVLRRLLGTYAQSIEAELLLDRTRNPGSPSPELARLRGARLVTTAEPGTGKRLDEGFIKQITGGDPVVARFLNQNPFEFTPQLKLWFAANHKPRITGNDYGIWRRIRLVPFDGRFDGKAADPELENKLFAEAGGILRWAVDGCLAWQEYGLSEPVEVIQATQAYRDGEDLLAPWIDECCVVDSTCETPIGDLWESWAKWSEGNGEKKRSTKWLSQQLDERGFKMRRTKSARMRTGIRVVGQASQAGWGG